MIHVRLLTPSEEDKYRRFLTQNPQALMYASLEFRRFLEAVLFGEPIYLIAWRNEEIVGALPCFLARDAELGAVVNSLPWFGSHGGCILTRREDSKTRCALLGRYLQMLVESRASFATMILSPFEEEYLSEYLARIPNAVTEQRIGQITELPDGKGDVSERLAKNFRPKTRNVVRKALKQGFALDTEDAEANWRFLADTHAENMAALNGRAKPWAHFAALRQTLPPQSRRLYIARLRGTPVAGLLLSDFNGTTEYLTPVIKKEYRSLQPLSFLIWHAMLESVRKGIRRWNWGGTWLNQRSLHHFKAGWGARDFPYTYVVYALPDALEHLKGNRARFEKAFPYYYLYPFAAL